MECAVAEDELGAVGDVNEVEDNCVISDDDGVVLSFEDQVFSDALVEKDVSNKSDEVWKVKLIVDFLLWSSHEHSVVGGVCCAVDNDRKMASPVAKFDQQNWNADSLRP